VRGDCGIGSNDNHTSDSNYDMVGQSANKSAKWNIPNSKEARVIFELMGLGSMISLSGKGLTDD